MSAGLPVLVASVGMTMCLGATYSWSLFVDPLKSALGIGQGASQVPFALFYVVFPLTTLFADQAISRLGLRGAAALGGLLFGGGWLLAGFGGESYLFVVIGIGAVGGVGVGLAYLVPIAVGVQWFPRHKGLVTGISVAGFGAGSALVAYAGGRLLRSPDATPFEVFSLLGLVFLVVILVASTQMRLPDGLRSEHRTPWSLPRAFRERGFTALYFAMFTGLMAGFVVIANLKQLTSSGDAGSGAAPVALFALANALGRIGWGAVSDRARMGVIVPANLLIQSGLLFAAPHLLGTASGLNLLAVLAGLNYGGVLVLYASAVARRWGAENVAGLYGQLFSANAPASFAPVAAGFLFDSTGSFALPLALVAIAMLFGAAASRRALSSS